VRLVAEQAVSGPAGLAPAVEEFVAALAAAAR
jgi:hypothetical protein